MSTVVSVMDYLTILSKNFDKFYDTVIATQNMSKEFDDDLKSLQNLGITELEIAKQLPEFFTPEKLVIFMRVLFQLAEFDTKFAPVLEERQKEFADISTRVTDTRNNLHKLLDEGKC